MAEGLTMRQVDRDTCMHCSACVGTCPFDAITLFDMHIVFNEKCVDCGMCDRVCPVGAISPIPGTERMKPKIQTARV
jgi:ferredoxin